jgi:hypothetical protein
MTVRNRGKESNDDKLFGKKWQPVFVEAIQDVSFLLTRGYGEKSSIQLVGNRYRMNTRQQKALLRMSAPKNSIFTRKQKAVPKEAIKKQNILIDGFNLLILLENALSHAYIFKSQDDAYRDISGVHGSYKRVAQTEKAIILVGDILQELKVKSVHWYFDSPISNSGRLKTILFEIAEKHEFDWQVTLVHNPDLVLAKSEDIIISSDAWILDECKQWFNLAALIIEEHLRSENIIYAT